ncbi:threonyl-tRNA synthetase [Helicobacter fennelliae]|uniref:Threonine--tRNA ligase n=1 Tax=Helicobacter fennelliae TaxID=215 RepID=A0A2X3E1K4_9HELI|nr:threonyl-tRNA synthetase [Helicobacter fennelliae]SQC36218.1 threonyl-tRNA synthetase [Helicobacter fennelliae]
MSEIIGFKCDDSIIDLQSAQNPATFNANTQEQKASQNNANNTKINEKIGEPIYFDNSKEALEIIRHSAAHLMAQAIKTLYPDAKFFVGPVVDEGFYYDFKTSAKIGEEDLITIEKKMKEIAKIGYPITKTTITRKQAEEKFKNDDLKIAVMSKIEGDSFGVYAQGDFEDLCRGPHLPNTKFLHYFKLTKLAGAYLGGDEKAQMLTRIYGIAFADKESLNAYLTQIEEAKKRDHRKIGQEIGLFTFDGEIGAGLPIWLPAGARLRVRLENLLTKALIMREYEPVRGPEILKSDVWKVSGHYDNYKENMYFTTIDETEYGIKPMNCVGHIKVYQSAKRSYRELPLRFYEYGVVHRHEKSGVLHGLLRVREFTQDDAHIFCLPNQIESEVDSIIDFTRKIMEAFGFCYEMELSTRPEKSIGDEAIWQSATTALKKALEKNQIQYQIDEGGGAFYGPKIDIKITDAIGRKWQCGTIQVDMNLPERFMLEYTDEENQAKRPVMLHRAILGSFERFVAILTEHFSGEFPFAIAPTQVVIIPISQAQLSYAKEIQLKIRQVGAYAEILNKNETLNKRIRTAEKQRVPMILVIGEKEVESKILAIRDRRSKQQYNLSEGELITLIESKLKEVSF